jgi:hypothetical protein
MCDKPCTRILGPSDSELVTRLRIEEVSKASELNLPSWEYCRWSESDESKNSVVLGVLESSSVLLSTMRGCYFPDASSLAENMSWFTRESLPKVLDDGDIVILGRAATRSDYSGNNLHSYLRYLFLKFCKQQSVRYVVGEIVSNARRVEQLRSLGYELYPGTASKNGPLGRSQDLYFVVLDLESRYEQAIAVLSSRVMDATNEFPWSGPEPIFHYS